jgi:predicted DCC family thiol-disulfide oxidoreductase YuxK
MRKQPVLVYDGDCGFCTSSVTFAQQRLHPACETIPWQHADLDALRTTRQRAEREVLWVTPTGPVHGGVNAIARLLLCSHGMWPVLGAMLTVPPLRWAAHGVYRLVANNRRRMPGGTAACALAAQSTARPTSTGVLGAEPGCGTSEPPHV